MKKLVMFLTLSLMAVSFNACSSDDDSGSAIGGTVNVKIDGVAKTFNTVTVNAPAPDSDGDVYLTVTAAQNDSPTELITFSLYKGDTGTQTFMDFMYVINGAMFNRSIGSFAENVTVNNDNNLKGTFSGQVSMWNNTTQEEDTHMITEGTFDIRY